MIRHFWLLAACIAAVALLSVEAKAEVLTQIPLIGWKVVATPMGNRPTRTNFSAWGTNDNALGGSHAQDWIVGPSRGGGANQVTDGNLASTIERGAQYDLDVTTVAPLGFRVEFDFNRFHPFNPGTGNGFVAVGLGADSSAVIGGGAFATNNSDLALVFQQGVGGTHSNMQILQDNVFLPGTGSEGPVDYGDPTVGHSVDLTLVPAVAGAYGDADTINGSLSIDGGTAYNFSVLGEPTSATWHSAAMALCIVRMTTWS